MYMTDFCFRINFRYNFKSVRVSVLYQSCVCVCFQYSCNLE
ncbi:hypothetical protein HanRHA438_Chr08g0349491 [Helianthus annuus]|nr:hypothetical protein HanRHA438_Chr08g0349491 [Helianthus annuus]